MTAPAVESAQAAADAELEPSASPTEDVVSPAPADTELAKSVDGTEPPDAETPPASDDSPATTASPSKEALAEPDLSGYAAFTYRGGGGEQEFPGTHVDDDGNVLFKKEAVDRLRHDLAYARAYPKLDAEAQRSVKQERTAREAAESALQHVLGTFDSMFEQGTWQDWAAQQASKWPELKASAQAKSFEIRSKQTTDELNQLRQYQQDTQLRPVMISRVEEAVRTWGAEAGLSPTEQATMLRKYQSEEGMEKLFPRATQDDPVNGTKAGQRTENLEPLRQELLFLHSMLKGRTPAQAAKDVQRENEKRQGQGAQKAPPVARVSAGKPAGTKPKTYGSTREADADIWS